MERLNPADRTLKRWLSMLRTHPSSLTYEKISDPIFLARLLPEHFQQKNLVDLPAPERVGRVFRHLVLDFLVNDLNASRFVLAESWLLVWFSFLDTDRLKFGKGMKITELVATYCQPDVVGVFLENDVKTFLERRPDLTNTSSVRMVMEIVSGETLKCLLGELSKGRKMLSNYLNMGVKRLVEYIAVMSPELLADEPVHHDAPVITEITGSCDDAFFDTYLQQTIVATETLPIAFGLSVDTDDYVQRDFDLSSIVGIASAPVISDPTARGLHKISGILVGEAGSGRTSHLVTLTRRMAQIHSQTGVVPIYCRVADFLPFARAQRTLYEFIAMQFLRTTEHGTVSRLESLNATGRLFLIGDGLDYLPPEDQAVVLSHLALFPHLIVSALPWQAERICQQICLPLVSRDSFGIFQLADLGSAQQHKMLQLLANNEPFDFSLAGFAIDELPWMASLPLGIFAIFQQIRTNTSNPGVISLSLLREIFAREGIKINFSVPETLDEFSMALVLATRAAGDVFNNPPPPDQISDLRITKKSFSSIPGFTDSWDIMKGSRLFIPNKDETDIRFGSMTLLPLLALAVATNQLTLLHLARTSDSQLTRQVVALSDSLWEWKCLTYSGVVMP